MEPRDRLIEESAAKHLVSGDQVNGSVRAGSRSRDQRSANIRAAADSERVELALWAGRAALWDWNVVTGIVHVNDSWANVFGYEWQEIEWPLQEWKELFHPEDLDALTDAMQAYIDGQDTHYEVECRMRDAQGQWVRIHFCGKMIFKDSKGRTLRTLGLCQRVKPKRPPALPILNPESLCQGMDGFSEMLVYEDLDHSIIWCSRICAENLAVPSRHMWGGECFKIWFDREEPCPNCLAMEMRKVGNGGSGSLATADNRIFDQSSYPLFDEQGKQKGSLVIIKDKTEQHLKSKALEDSEQRYRTLFENNPVGLFKYDAQGNITDINQYLLNVLGAPCRDNLRYLTQLAASDKEISLIKYELLETIREGKAGSGEIRFVSPWGRKIWLQYRANPVYDQSGNVKEVIVACEEISERKQAEERIRYLSFNDPLTGLYNRAFFCEELKRLNTQRQLPMSIIIADLNGLKLINDAFGHQKGDLVLKAAADILRASCRHEDIIARLGGDEFVVLLPITSSEVAEDICSRIKKNCQKPGEGLEQVSLSLGMATRFDIGQDMEDVLNEAEDRMYRNKLIESRTIRSAFIISLERTLREKSHETEEHTLRLQNMSRIVGEGLGMGEAELDALGLLAALHDIGKIAIPSTILDKADRLSGEEWDTVKRHSEIGYRIALSTPELIPIAEAILAHHESWDGTGYPLGLREEKIPLLSRIMAVCDAYDVMVNGRPYQDPLSKQEALKELQRCAGRQFDPNVVRIFLEKLS